MDEKKDWRTGRQKKADRLRAIHCEYSIRRFISNRWAIRNWG